MKLLRKIVGKTKIGRIRSQQNKEPSDIQQLISGWKAEEENGKRVVGMEAQRLVKSQGTIYL